MPGAEGFFHSPYSPESVVQLAKSEDPFERWVAANAIPFLDQQTSSLVGKILTSEQDSLVLSALAANGHFADGSSRRPKLSVQGNNESFVAALSGPVSPEFKEDLSAFALSEAKNTLNVNPPAATRSTSFPQANSLVSLMGMLDQLIKSRAILGRKLGLSDRQVSYYRDALKYLGLIVKLPSSDISVPGEVVSLDGLMPKQKFILGRVLGVKTVAAAFLGRQLAGRINVGPLPATDKEVIDYFALSDESSGLTGETLRRRAETALSWADQVGKLVN